MPRGRPRKNPDDASTATATSPAGDTRPVTKTDAVIEALTRLGADAKPKEIQEFAQNEFGLTMPTSLISNYKSVLGKRLAGQSRLVRAPKAAAATSSKPRSVSSVSLVDLQAIKALVDRLGSEQVAAVAQLLAK